MPYDNQGAPGEGQNVQGSFNDAEDQQGVQQSNRTGLSAAMSQITGQGATVVGPNAGAYNSLYNNAGNQQSYFMNQGQNYTQAAPTIANQFQGQSQQALSDLQKEENGWQASGGTYNDAIKNAETASTDQSIAAQMAMARSATGGPSQVAGALRQGQQNAAIQTQQGANAAAQLGSQMALTERGQNAQMLGQQGQQLLGQYGLEQGSAEQQAQLDLANQGQQNQMQLGLYGLGTNEQGLQQNALNSYTMGSLGAQQQQEANDNDANASGSRLLSGLVGAAGGAMMSDEDMKTDIAPASAGPDPYWAQNGYGDPGAVYQDPFTASNMDLPNALRGTAGTPVKTFVPGGNGVPMGGDADAADAGPGAGGAGARDKTPTGWGMLGGILKGFAGGLASDARGKQNVTRYGAPSLHGAISDTRAKRDIIREDAKRDVLKEQADSLAAQLDAQQSARMRQPVAVQPAIDRDFGGGQQNAADAFMQTARPYTYDYKNPAINGGQRRLGPMAQDLERGPTGPDLVKDTPAGKMVDTRALSLANAGAVGRLHDRVSELENQGAPQTSNLSGLMAAGQDPSRPSLVPAQHGVYSVYDDQTRLPSDERGKYDREEQFLPVGISARSSRGGSSLASAMRGRLHR